MQFVSLALGFFLARPVWHLVSEKFFFAMLGTALISGGAAAYNHFLEWPLDATMDRTKNRPIPTGRIRPTSAFVFATILLLVGVTVLWLHVNLWTAGLGLLTAVLYVLVYTPLKQLTWFNTYVGALPGAIPPLGGWAAATGGLTWEPFLLAAILAIWQIPHFFAIAWMYQEDYAKAGFKMLPKFDPSGTRTVRQMIVSSAILLGASVLPFFAGLLGVTYVVGAVGIGLWFGSLSLKFAKDRSKANAKKVLRGSIIYLPVLLLLMALDLLF